MTQYILKNVLELIKDYMVPKETEKKEFGEVFTPLFLIEEMLEHLPTSIWLNKDLKWYDPSSGIGIFAIIIYYKLFSGLKHIIKDDKERSKWIIENMLYLNELNPTNVLKTKQIFVLLEPDANLNITCTDFLLEKIKLEKYNVIVGNPPYNKSRLNGTFDSSLYPQFVVKALSVLSDEGMLLFITPSRWFSGGNGLNDFRDYMLKRNDIVLIKHYDNSKTIWPTVDIAGGINYFLIVLNQFMKMNINNNNGLTHFIDAATGKTSDINLNTYDILVQNVDAYSMIDRILKESNQTGISTIYLSTKYFGINTNSEHFLNANDKGPESDSDKGPVSDSDKDLSASLTGSLSLALRKCYVSKKKGSIKYVDPIWIKNPYNFWKVFSLQACGKINDGFKTLIIGSPDEIASQTFFTFKVNSRLEAESLKSYLETDYANFMLKLRKIDHHINKNTLKWILLPPLNKIWTNDSINTFFGLTKREIDTITDI
jgi:site-specific DNA-methyltransferase (adenine-specific)